MKNQCLLITVTFVLLIVSGCNTSPLTATIQPTLTLMRFPLKVGITEFRLTAVREETNALGRKPEAGYRLLNIGIEMRDGYLQENQETVKQWQVSLRDSTGKNYTPFVSGSGIFCPGEGMRQACWTFSVLKDAKSLTLLLPEGVLVDLDPWIIGK